VELELDFSPDFSLEVEVKVYSDQVVGVVYELELVVELVELVVVVSVQLLH
jgi:hypothetical protein